MAWNNFQHVYNKLSASLIFFNYILLFFTDDGLPMEAETFVELNFNNKQLSNTNLMAVKTWKNMEPFACVVLG